MHFAIIHGNFKAFVIKLEEYLTKKQPQRKTKEREWDWESGKKGEGEQILAPKRSHVERCLERSWGILGSGATPEHRWIWRWIWAANHIVSLLRPLLECHRLAYGPFGRGWPPSASVCSTRLVCGGCTLLDTPSMPLKLPPIHHLSQIWPNR